jgi:hypothetical protein
MFSLVIFTLLSHFITVPVAILVGSFAYVWLDNRLIAIAGLPPVTASGRTESAPDLRQPVPKARVLRLAGWDGWAFLLSGALC